MKELIKYFYILPTRLNLPNNSFIFVRITIYV